MCNNFEVLLKRFITPHALTAQPFIVTVSEFWGLNCKCNFLSKPRWIRMINHKFQGKQEMLSSLGDEKVLAWEMEQSTQDHCESPKSPISMSTN